MKTKQPKRYWPDVVWTPAGDLAVMSKANNGEYVKYSTYARLRRQLAALKVKDKR